MGIQFDATADRISLIFLNMIDEHSRLCLAIRVGTCCQVKDTVAVVDELCSLYPAPAFILSDNAPEFLAHTLRSWCQTSGTLTSYIEPVSRGRKVLLNRST
jgi:hypothetical protein